MLPALLLGAGSHNWPAEHRYGKWPVLDRETTDVQVGVNRGISFFVSDQGFSPGRLFMSRPARGSPWPDPSIPTSTKADTGVTDDQMGSFRLVYSGPPKGSPPLAAVAATFLRFVSLASFRETGPPNTSLSAPGFGLSLCSLLFGPLAAASRRAFWRATRSALSGSLHLLSFLTRGRISFWHSGLGDSQ